MAPGERALGHARFLCDVAELSATSLTRALLVNRLAQAAVRHFSDACSLHLIGADEVLTVAAFAERQPRTGAGKIADVGGELLRDGILRETMRSGHPLVVRLDGSRDSLLEKQAARILHAISMRSLIVVPISLGSECIGALTFLEASALEAYDFWDLEFALAAGRQLGVALENVTLREDERRGAERARLLARATDQLFATTDRNEMLQLLLGVAVEEFADWAVAVSQSRESLNVIATAESKTTAQSRFGRLSEGTNFSKAAEQSLIAAIHAKQPLVVNEISKSPSQGLEPRAWMIAPLAIGGHHYGAVVCYSTARRYDDSDLEILQELCRRTSLGLEYAESLAPERRLTQTLQQATLPSNLAEVPGATLSAAYLPAAQQEQVGGDWYDAFSLDDYRVLVTIGDVTGHGLQASVIMGKLRHALNVVGIYETDPSRILDVAERIVLRRYPEAVATAFVAVIDTRRQTVTYANAGHPSPMLRMRDGSVRLLAAEGLPVGLRHLGLSESRPARTLKDVELMFFYTDGLTEASRDAIEGERLLTEALARKAAVLVGDAADFVKTSCMSAPAFDDIALLSLNFVALDRWGFNSSDRQAAQAARKDFRDKLRRRGMSQEDYGAAELIFGELAANVARHAPGPVDVALEWRDSQPMLHVVDRGGGYQVVQLQGADVLSEQGRGLWLVQCLGGEIDVKVLPRFGTHTRVMLPTAATRASAA